MERPVKPHQVVLGVRLLYAAIGIGVLRALQQVMPILLKHKAIIPYLIISIILIVAFGLKWLIIYKVARGRNWARITLLVLFIIQIPVAILWSLPYKVPPGFKIAGIIQMILDAVAVVLLFQHESNKWFNNIIAIERAEESLKNGEVTPQ